MAEQTQPRAAGILRVIDLSILICSTHTRWDNFGQAIQKQVWDQYAKLREIDRSRIEILMLTDNKSIILGRKRNLMVSMASGRYVQFVDDDDRIEPDMFASVLAATEHDPDCVTFLANVSLNGRRPRPCKYSLEFEVDRNTAGLYERVPNHICAIRRDLAAKVAYPEILSGEDTGYSQKLRPLLKTEVHIPKILYHYDYSSETTETQRKHPVADVVILSNASNIMLRRSTQKTIDTCISGAGQPVTVTVLEQRKGTTYRGAKTVYMDGDFHYNRFANYGARLGKAPWIVIANNDLVFHPGWLEQLLAAKHPLVSPKEPTDQRQKSIRSNTVGDVTGKHLSGWCYMISRDLFNRIGGFDETVSFWCSDDVVIEQAKEQGVKPMLVPKAIVEHKPSTTVNKHPAKDELTWGQLEKFIAKYGSHRMEKHPDYLAWLNR